MVWHENAQVGEFRLPTLPGAKEAPAWGYLNVAGDYLIGGADPLFDPSLIKKVTKGGDDDDDHKVTKPRGVD